MPRADGLPAVGLALTGLLLRLPFAARYPHGAEAPGLARSLSGYELEILRVQFPGDPVFVWLARVVQAWVLQPYPALGLVSAVAGAAAAGLFYLLALALFREWLFPAAGDSAAAGSLQSGPRQTAGEVPAAVPTPGEQAAAQWLNTQARLAAAVAALWLAVSPLTWVLAGQPLADTLGLALWQLAMLAGWRWLTAAGRRAGLAWAGLAGLCLGLILGTRPAYFPLGVSLAMLARWSRSRSSGTLAAATLGLAAGLLPWVAWQWAWVGALPWARAGQAAMAGGLAAWLPNLSAHTPLQRFKWFFGRHWVGLGLGGPVPGQPVWGWLVVLVLCLGLAAWLRYGPPRRVGVFLGAWLTPYLAWAYLTQNPTDYRGVLPLVPWAILVAVGGWLGWVASALAPAPEAHPVGSAGWAQTAAAGQRAWLRRRESFQQYWRRESGNPPARLTIAVLVGAALLGSVWLVAWPLVRAQHRAPPPAVQLAVYLQDEVPAPGAVILLGPAKAVVDQYAPEHRTIRAQGSSDVWWFLQSAGPDPTRVLVSADALGQRGPAWAELQPHLRPLSLFAGHPLLYPWDADLMLYEVEPDYLEQVRRR